jgi:hypothetical protein
MAKTVSVSPKSRRYVGRTIPGAADRQQRLSGQAQSLEGNENQKTAFESMVDLVGESPPTRHPCAPHGALWRRRRANDPG